jgi:hypothetical protein
MRLLLQCLVDTQKSCQIDSRSYLLSNSCSQIGYLDRAVRFGYLDPAVRFGYLDPAVRFGYLDSAVRFAHLGCDEGK